MTFIRPRGVRAHNLSYGPKALWQLAGNMDDATGNGHTLTLENGTEKYGALADILGFYFDGSTNLWRSVADATLVELGDMTIEMLIAWHPDDPGVGVNAAKYLYTHTGTGSGADVNHLYAMRALSSLKFRYFAEQGAAQTNIQYDTDDAVGLAGQVMHYAMVRESNQVTFYINGRSQGTSSGLLAPTGGGNGRFRMGCNLGPSDLVSAIIASFKFLDIALTPDQILGEARGCLG